tara:strand:- start:940 stop:1170 length:231 start_codon:yes stop_codon:yes gene_type:complete
LENNIHKPVTDNPTKEIRKMKIDELVIQETEKGKFCLMIKTPKHGLFPLNEEVYITEMDAIKAKFIAEKTCSALFN